MFLTYRRISSFSCYHYAQNKHAVCKSINKYLINAILIKNLIDISFKRIFHRLTFHKLRLYSMSFYTLTKCDNKEATMNKELLFYEPFDAHGYLSNFANYPIKFEKQNWKTSEHCYQANKFTDKFIINKIKDASTPDEAFLLSRKYNLHIRNDWIDIRYQRMMQIVRAKFNQHSRLAYYLVATENTEIKEHSHKDDYWGDGGDGQGQNCLGKILMQVREELKCTVRFSLLSFAESSKLPTLYSECKIHDFYEPITGNEQIALTFQRWDKS